MKEGISGLSSRFASIDRERGFRGEVAARHVFELELYFSHTLGDRKTLRDVTWKIDGGRSQFCGDERIQLPNS